MRTRTPNGVRCGHARESGQAMVEFALILFPAPAPRRGDHPVRHRTQLLARHAAHRKPGCALGGCQQLALGLSARLADVPEPEHAPGDTPRPDACRPGCRQARRPASRSVTGRHEADRRSGASPIRSAFDLLPILGVGSLNFKAKATMRLEHTQVPLKGGLITGDVHAREAARKVFSSETWPGRRPLRVLLPVMFGLAPSSSTSGTGTSQAPSADPGRCRSARRGPQLPAPASSTRPLRDLAIANTAFRMLATPHTRSSSVNQQVETSGVVRVMLNSERYSAGGARQTSTTTGYGITMDRSATTAPALRAARQCRCPATDADVPKVSGAGIRPEIQARTPKADIHQVKGGVGLRPLAVPGDSSASCTRILRRLRAGRGTVSVHGPAGREECN